MTQRAILLLASALMLTPACGPSDGVTGPALEGDPHPGDDGDPRTGTVGPAGALGAGIVFTSDRNGRTGTREIYVAHTDGSVVQVTHGSGWANAPDWSPDRDRIAFSRGGDIFVSRPDGTGLSRVTDDRGGYVEDFDPSWSPDGTRIAFSRDLSGWFELDLHIVDVDGTNLVRLTHGTGALGPAWSPDGRWIADGYLDVFVRRANGSQTMNLTRALPGTHHSPSWSPDGKRIAWVTHRDGNADIYVMNADGSEVERLTHGPAYDGAPTWSPDGTRIAFATNRDGNGEIYVMSADGSGPVNLTRHPAHDWDPSW